MRIFLICFLNGFLTVVPLSDVSSGAEKNNDKLIEESYVFQ
jgi:hypothetical protein